MLVLQNRPDCVKNNIIPVYLVLCSTDISFLWGVWWLVHDWQGCEFNKTDDRVMKLARIRDKPRRSTLIIG